MTEDLNSETESRDEFIESIAGDVMGCLTRDRFFERLEKIVWPEGPDGQKVCDHSFAKTLELTAAHGHPSEDQEEIIGVLQSRGGFCDCEVILNAAPTSQARDRYWRKRAAEELDTNR